MRTAGGAFVKKRIATLALLVGLVAAPGFVADAHAGGRCHRRHDHSRYDSGYRYGGYYDDDYRYSRFEPRYRYASTYGYGYAPRASFVLPFPPPIFSFHFGHR
jgi:hypothetical protein